MTIIIIIIILIIIIIIIILIIIITSFSKDKVYLLHDLCTVCNLVHSFTAAHNKIDPKNFK